MIKLNFKILFLFFFLFFGKLLYAQNTYQNNNNRYDSIVTSDYLFENFLFYKYENDVLITDLGPFGSLNYLISNNLKNQKSYLNNFNLDSLRGIKPFTNISYINASRKEQIFSVKHYQQFGNNLIFHLDLNKISTPGEFLNQEVNHTKFTTSIKYHSTRYSVKFLTAINKHTQQENGGLLNTNNFENAIYSNFKGYGVYLLSSNVLIKRKNFNLQQQLTVYNFNTDSLTSDKVYLRLTSSYSSKKRVFYDNDPLSLIYRNIFLDSISTIDSIYQDNFNNRLSFGVKYKRVDFKLFTSVGHLNYMQSFGVDTNYNNVYTGFKYSYKLKKIHINAEGKYGVYGFNKNDISSGIGIDYLFFDKLKFSFNSNFNKTEPALKFKTYTSNHFKWSNYSFVKQNVLNTSANISINKWKLVVSLDNKLLNNILYYNYLAKASQNNGTISTSTFGIAKNYSILKFHFRTALKYQLTTNKILFPLPQFITRQLVYYENRIFKKALKIQIGFNVSYATGYYGYAYMPALTAFYTQRDTQLGYYPKLDLFINTHIKRAQIFLKYEHINAGRSLDKSYSVPGYPILSKSLKFGISWNFID